MNVLFNLFFQFTVVHIIIQLFLDKGIYLIPSFYYVHSWMGKPFPIFLVNVLLINKMIIELR